MATPQLLLTGIEYCPYLPVDSRELRQIMACLLQAGKALHPMPAVELVLVRDADMALCNGEYMSLPGPTNVLSFPSESYEEPEKEPGDEPDRQTGKSAQPSAQPPAQGKHGAKPQPSMPAGLILSVDTLNREAFLYKENPREHLLRLLAHGLGHAAGFDHSPEMDLFCDNILLSLQNTFLSHRKTG